MYQVKDGCGDASGGVLFAGKNIYPAFPGYALLFGTEKGMVFSSVFLNNDKMRYSVGVTGEATFLNASMAKDVSGDSWSRRGRG